MALKTSWWPWTRQSPVGSTHTTRTYEEVFTISRDEVQAAWGEFLSQRETLVPANKPYILRPFGARAAMIPAEHILLRLAADLDRLLTLRRLFYADYWLVTPWHGDRRGSQVWHRDPERDPRKVFLYLTDVTEDAGPLEFRDGPVLCPAWTVVIADTRHEHRGGYASARERHCLHWSYALGELPRFRVGG